MTMNGTTSDNEWYNEWQWVTTGFHFRSFPFISNKSETYLWAPWRKLLYVDEDLLEELLNLEQKQVPKKEY